MNIYAGLSVYHLTEAFTVADRSTQILSRHGRLQKLRPQVLHPQSERLAWVSEWIPWPDVTRGFIAINCPNGNGFPIFAGLLSQRHDKADITCSFIKMCWRSIELGSHLSGLLLYFCCFKVASANSCWDAKTKRSHALGACSSCSNCERVRLPPARTCWNCLRLVMKYGLASTLPPRSP